MSSGIVAATSLSPDARRAARQRQCVASWRHAGLRVVSFNHASEIQTLRRSYDIEFEAVEQTSAHIFGRHFVPINAMLDWGANLDAKTLLINSDIELKSSAFDLARVTWLSEGGLCYIVRHNQDPISGKTWLEPSGIDGFLLDGRDAQLFARSFLSMGQPFWDYWIPFVFAAAGRTIRSVEYPLALHRCHVQSWNSHDWHRCALEFDRMSGLLQDDKSFSACMTMARRVRNDVERTKSSIAPKPVDIRAWVKRQFDDPSPKTFLELGSHDGSDTSWMADLPNVTVHAFEPDPRNHQCPRNNVVVHRAAIGDFDGSGSFIQSKVGWGREWTYSSSIKRPKNHLSRYPVTFAEPINVEIRTLDRFRRDCSLDLIDFIWADIQGAEGDMIRGGRETLARTRFLYTEYSNEELYESQVTLHDIVTMLPEFRVIEIWADDVLLENRALAGRGVRAD